MHTHTSILGYRSFLFVFCLFVFYIGGKSVLILLSKLKIAVDFFLFFYLFLFYVQDTLIYLPLHAKQNLKIKCLCEHVSQIATFVYRFFDGCLPGYLSQTLCAYEPTRNLRSSCEKLLKVPKRNTKTFGERSFSFLAPSVWNSLPSDLRNSSTLPLFKSRLKTHLFTPPT